MTPVDEFNVSPAGRVPSDTEYTGAGNAENVNASVNGTFRRAVGAMMLSTGVGASQTTVVCVVEALPETLAAVVVNV
jgi:hypothetical protein